MIRINFDHGPKLSLSLSVSEPTPETASAPYSVAFHSSAAACASSDKTQDSSSTEQDANNESVDDLLTPEIQSLQESRLRKCQEIGQVLKQFTRTIKQESRPPKLENLRYRVMRSLKKFIRRLLQDKEVSKKGLLAIQGEIDSNSLDQLQEYCQMHKDALKEFSSLKNGPCVDHRRSGPKTGHNTYNNNYMREIFRQAEVKEAYTHYIQLLFSKDEPDGLCHRFKIQCCSTGQHCQACTEKWNEFKKILMDFLGADVEVSGPKGLKV